MVYVPPIGLWMIGGIVAKRRREEEEQAKKKEPSIDMGSPHITMRKRERMCIKAQSDNPCHSSIECGHGELHICHGNDCLEPGHFCTTIREESK